jgi:RNA recognition motif-containing protein
VTNEEDLRKHFADVAKLETAGAGNQAVGDGILNVRVVRDPVTHIGKGIAYVQFTSKMLMRLAIEKKTGSEFKGRQIRIKKAVAPQRLEKKKMRKEQSVIDREQKKEDKKEQDDEDDRLLAQKGQDAYQSDDSFEERYGQRKEAKFSEKQIKKQDDLALHIAKI